MNGFTQILIATFVCLTIAASAQKDSTRRIHIGCDFLVTPMLHLNDNGTFNTGTGILFHVNMGNSIVFKLGAMYHIKPYSVIDDKYYSSAPKSGS